MTQSVVVFVLNRWSLKNRFTDFYRMQHLANFVLAFTQHSNRFLQQVPVGGSTIHIYWVRGCSGPVAVCPGAEGCFCVCVCAPICSFLHTEPLLWCLWHSAVTVDWELLPVPPPGFLLGHKEERQVKNHILNYFSYREWIIEDWVKCQIKCKHWLLDYQIFPHFHILQSFCIWDIYNSSFLMWL